MSDYSTDEERVLGERPIAPTKDGGNKRTIDVREVINGLVDVPSAGWSAGRIIIYPCSDGICASHNQPAERSHGH
ncbi:hypothetical protein [Bradyrhizobium sp. RP6]|uniref:hypothetical protein n=1 Tax=Bradyrhizobium sp. RP6 TaxID=2489596 RepID=UPI000F543A1E|nr:hypothetical protein [Bradyrhizobium sp. RP6]RQH10413.1 hypothetical protein EHH60_23155 [Bradyrhizobium sp. RP6]